MNLKKIEKWQEELQLSIFWKEQDFISEIPKKIVKQVFDIIDYKWDICPSCSSLNFSDGKCFECWYWCWEDFFIEEELKREEKNIRNLKFSKKMKWNWKKFFLFHFKWQEVNYFHYPKNVNENEAIFKVKISCNTYIITVWFEKCHKKHFQDSSLEYDYLNISLKKPKNFDWKHFVVDSKWKWVYFDYKLAEKIVKEILSRKF